MTMEFGRLWESELPSRRFLLGESWRFKPKSVYQQDMDLAMASTLMQAAPWEPLCEAFSLDDIPEHYIKRFFRFKTAADIQRLSDLLQMPAEVKAPNGTTASGMFYDGKKTVFGRYSMFWFLQSNLVFFLSIFKRRIFVNTDKWFSSQRYLFVLIIDRGLKWKNNSNFIFLEYYYIINIILEYYCRMNAQIK